MGSTPSWRTQYMVPSSSGKDRWFSASRAGFNSPWDYAGLHRLRVRIGGFHPPERGSTPRGATWPSGFILAALRRGVGEFGVPAGLITLRSWVQIPPPLRGLRVALTERLGQGLTPGGKDGFSWCRSARRSARPFPGQGKVYPGRSPGLSAVSPRCGPKSGTHSGMAQSVARLTVNQRVLGSSPGTGA